MTVRKKKVTVFLSICWHNVCATRRRTSHTDTIPAARRNLFRFSFHILSSTTFYVAETKNAHELQQWLRTEKNVWKIYKPKLTTIENKLKKINLKTRQLVAESHTVRVQSSFVCISSKTKKTLWCSSFLFLRLSKSQFYSTKHETNGIKFENKS